MASASVSNAPTFNRLTRECVRAMRVEKWISRDSLLKLFERLLVRRVYVWVNEASLLLISLVTMYDVSGN